MGVSDDARAYGSATYHCTSAHGPACPARGAVGELANPASPDDDDLEEEDDAVVIMHAAHVGGDVDIAQIMRMFENGAFDEALGRAKRKKNGNPEAKAEPEPEAAKRRDRVAAAKRFFRARDNEHETDDVPTLARYGVTGEALPNDAATTWPSGVRSTPSRETRKVEFLNARSSTTAVYWVDFDGKETHYVDLPPGMSTLMSTFATHSWVARDMASARHRRVHRAAARGEPVRLEHGPGRPRRFVVVDAAERDMASDDASETLVKTARREIPAPAPAEPTKPRSRRSRRSRRRNATIDRHAIGRSRQWGGREPERESGGRRAESVRVRRREGTWINVFRSWTRRRRTPYRYRRPDAYLYERARYDSPRRSTRFGRIREIFFHQKSKPGGTTSSLEFRTNASPAGAFWASTTPVRGARKTQKTDLRACVRHRRSRASKASRPAEHAASTPRGPPARTTSGRTVMVAVAPAPAPAAAAAGRASASASGVRANAPPARRGASVAAAWAGRLGRDAPAPLARRAASLVARSSSAEAERGTAPTEGDAPATDRVVRLAFSMPDWTGEGEALVVGSAPALGDWDPDVGLELRGCQRDPSGAPDAWTGLVKLPRRRRGRVQGCHPRARRGGPVVAG